ncbi:MAG: ATP-binding protein, partial [Ignavibacteriaceae bacterium]|nr:ATP-binding protein [Ignavibacteriaceae bacterium]
QQLEMAKAAASGIGAYLNELIDDMHLLSNYPGIKRFDKKRIKMNADLLIEHYNDKIVKTIFVLDGEGRQVYYTGSDPQASSYYGPDFELSKMRTDETRFFRIEPFYKGNAKSGLIFVMLMPFEQERKNKKLSGRTGYDDSGMTQRKGYIGLIVSFDSLIHKYIVPLKLGEKDFAWIMDGGGRLIYHPRHKDMLLRSINGTSSNCLKCHSSFDVQRKMIRGNSSYDEYTIGNEAPKIMAYVPISLNGDKWILAISTFLPEVTASLREKFVLFFGLGILILFVILSLGALLYFQTTKKIRAEESNRHMEQRQSFQDQLSHAGKLASIGELVDSVAHEINTPLGIITSYIDALKLQKDYPLKYAADFDVIKNQTKRINNYTKSLLNYSHRIPFNPKPEELTTVLEECLFLLNPLFQSKKIRITKAYEHNLPKVEMDKRQIEQVFINLFNNAADAIVNNGNIKIEVSTEVRNISVVNKEEIKYAAIAITDNGRGIEPGDVSNIFESFFTTKREGKGTGLGLSISKAIILRHKGKIEVLSEPGKFTTFRIFLPINNNNKGQSA